MRSIKPIIFFTITLLLTACVEDLAPESKDIRSSEDFEIIISDNFNVLSTEEVAIDLEEELANHDAVVLYFTMWCTTCGGHMDEINYKMDSYPNVRFLIVDFVSSTMSQSQNYQRDNGYTHMTTLVDTNDLLQNMYDGKMASSIIINNQKEIQFNEVYKSRLYDVLDNL